MATQEIASLYELKGRAIVWEKWMRDCVHWIETNNIPRAMAHLQAIKGSMEATNKKIEELEGK